jgi:hypothetical protein
MRQVVRHTTHSSDIFPQADTSLIWPRSYVFALYSRWRKRRWNTINASCVLKSRRRRHFVSSFPDEHGVLDWKLGSWLRHSFVSFPFTKWCTVEFWISRSCALHHGQLQWTSGTLVSYALSAIRLLRRPALRNKSVFCNAEAMMQKSAVEVRFECSFCYSL